MRFRGWQRVVAGVVVCLGISARCAMAQDRPGISTPKEFLGFNLGDDYQVANYTQLEGYWKKLAAESDRMKLVSIGQTSEGRPQYMAIISSPENLKKLAHYREIAQKLALAKDLTEEQAKQLAKEGKAVVWIDGGLHASETVGSQQIMEWVYQMNARNDEETRRFLDDVIVLCVQANPDGQELVANWYMRNPDPLKRGENGGGMNVPRLWNKYAGHDNNRDFFMSNLAETTNINRQLSRVWFPQIMYNHHQTGPIGTVIFVPPFRDPNNYHYDQLIPVDIQAVGTAIHQRFIEENKPGSTMRSGANYSTWYNGGLRTVTYFHNQIGILTEIIGGPTPSPLPLVPAKQLASSDLPYPVQPQVWHYRQSIDYEMTANRAILNYASKNREQLLMDIYHMGRNSIQRGSEDSWTITPKRIEALHETVEAEEKSGSRGGDRARAGGSQSGVVPTKFYTEVLHDAAHRDPRVYIISADQPDFPTATKFVNTLMKNGVEVLQANDAFVVNGKSYPKNSYVVKSAQAFRPFILDMFEPQDHPDDFRYPGGPPVPPYDVAGYTLAMQMGVAYDRFFDDVKGPFATITTDLASPVAGSITGDTRSTKGYLVRHSYNDAVILTNRLLKAGCNVFWLKTPTNGMAEGALWIPATAKSRPIVSDAVKKLGLSAVAISAVPVSRMVQLHMVRIGLADQYGGSMPSGWTRWLLEQYEFPFAVVYPQALDAGHLCDKFDVLILQDGAIRGQGGRGRAAEVSPDTIPEQYRSWLGRITEEKTIPKIKEFVTQGGTVLGVGSSSLGLAKWMRLPVHNALTEMKNGEEWPLPEEKFYIPGSLLRAQVDNSKPLAYGMPKSVDVFFDNDPSFRLEPNAAQQGVTAISWYDGEKVLESGWAWGQQYLDGTASVVQVSSGKGRVVLFGPEITFRGQPHGTFKLLFNGIYESAAKDIDE